MKKSISLYFGLLLSLSIQAAPLSPFLACPETSPVMNCATVLPNGDVTLTWLTPNNTGVFDSYHIFRSNTPAGPFVVLDSIFVPGQTTYTHLGANANIGPVYYFIQTRCSDQSFSPALDTIHSIFLNVSNPSNGTAVLSWNPMLTDTVSTYSIYQEYPAGTWTLTGSKNNPAGASVNLSFIDTVFICNATINYKIEITDSSGCISASSISGGTFQNTIVPAIPLFDTMSVDDTNKALMSWNVSPSTDVEGYVIYQFNGASWIPVDSVIGIDSTGYNYQLSNAGFSSEQYRLAAYDSCGNISPQGAVFSTMYLTASSDICSRSAILSWTAYSTFTGGLAHYRIFQATAGMSGPYTLIDSVVTGTLMYISSDLAPNTMYYYKIEAVDNSGTKTASSNRLAFYSATPDPPQFLYLQNVSVVDPNRIDLTCHIDVTSPASIFKIMRSKDTVAGNFVQVGTVTSTGTSPILYTDNTALPDGFSYYYKVISVDSCGYDGMESNVSSNMLLSIESNSESSTNTLTWNDYQYWIGGVASYTIYRSIDGVLDTTPIATVSYSGTGTNTYTDDISLLLQGQGVFSYYVKATEGGGNTYGFTETSFSNTAEGYQDSKIFIPNAFSSNADGKNDMFIPITTYVDYSDYKFQVFNRMGLMMFSTTDIKEGWDGTYKGRLCESGVFVYQIQFKSSRGEYIDLKGSVTLLR